MKRLLIFTLALTLLGTAMAQSEVELLTLDSCKAYALRNQAAMKNALLDVEMAKETRRAALTKFFPSVSVTAGYYRSQNPLVDINSADEGANIEITSSNTGETLQQQLDDLQQQIDEAGFDVDVHELINGFLNDYGQNVRITMLDHGAFAQAVAMQPIFAGGRIVNGNRLAKLGVKASELKLVMTQNEVVLNTEQYYWRGVSLQEKLRTIDYFQTLLDTLEHDAQAAFDAGVLGRNDLLKVRLKQNETKALRIQLTNGISMATMALCQYVGLPYGDSLHYRFESLSDSQLLLTNAWVTPERAVEGRAESQLLETAVEADRLQKAMTMGEALPQVAVGATYGTNNLIGSDFRQNGILFATVSVPLSAWWETAHNMRRETLQRQQSENKRDDLRQQMVLQTYQAWNEMNEAWELVGVRREAVANAADNLTETGHYYKAGLTSLSDYLEAQTMLQQAQDQLIDQMIAYHLKVLQYRQLTEQ